MPTFRKGFKTRDNFWIVKFDDQVSGSKRSHSTALEKFNEFDK